MSPANAVIRLNIDLAARQFQKEGFAPSTIRDPSTRVIVLTRAFVGNIIVEALLDKQTLVYTARSQDLVSKASASMRYQCVASAPFDVAVTTLP